MGLISRIFHKMQKGGEAPHDAPRLEVVATEAGPEMELWTVGGGKGGVGKSLIASNMGVLLSRAGHRVLLVDADLGAPNLHTFLGMDGGKLSLSSFLNNKVSNIGDLVSKTGFADLDLISGAKDTLDVADAGSDKIERLKGALGSLDYDYILMDIGPGTTSNMLDLFLSGDEGLLVTTPEPTSIENTYRFIKCLILRRMRNVINSHGDVGLKNLLKSIFENPAWSHKVKTVADIIRHLRELDPERGEALRRLMGDTSISLVINSVRRQEDESLGSAVSRACHDYFGMEIRPLGSIASDDFVAESIRMRRPLVNEFPGSRAAASIEACLKTVRGSRARRKTAAGA